MEEDDQSARTGTRSRGGMTRETWRQRCTQKEAESTGSDRNRCDSKLNCEYKNHT